MFPASQPVIHTERLILRQLNAEDAEDLFALRSNPAVNRYINRNPETSAEGTLAFIEKINGNIAQQKSLYWGISPLSSGKLAGTICLWNFSADGWRVEIGYELLPAYQGRGWMQEAAAAVIDFASGSLGLKMISALVQKENLSSVRVLKKLGFHHDTAYSIMSEEEAEGLDVFYLKME